MGLGPRVGLGLGFRLGLGFQGLGWALKFRLCCSAGILGFCSRGGLRAPRPARTMHDGSPAAAAAARGSRGSQRKSRGGPRQPQHKHTSNTTNTKEAKNRKPRTRKSQSKNTNKFVFTNWVNGEAARLPDVCSQVCSASADKKSCLWNFRSTLGAHARRVFKRLAQK